MPYVEVSALIAAPATEIYPVLKDMEKYPDFMQDLVSVTVLERSANQTVTSWVSNVDGRCIKWKEQDIFDDEHYRITYSQIEGDLKKFAGEWLLLEDSGKTQLTLTVNFEFGIPMIAGLLHPLLKRKVRENSLSMIHAVKRRLEGE